MNDATKIANQIRSILMMIVGFVLALLLAGTVARAARLGVPYLPALDPTGMAYIAIAYWAMK